MLYPESLDSSKILTFITEPNNLSFKVTDLLSIKEVSKYTSEKDELIPLLSKIDYIKLSENKERVSILIPENFAVFSLLNVPQKMTEEELIKLISIPKENFLRIYKKSLFWVIVTNREADNYDNSNNFSTSEIENKLKNVEFSDGGKLRYDYMTKGGLIKSINKQIQTSNYHKESHELKASGGQANGNSSSRKISSNAYNSNNKDRTNSEALSWRKKSIENNTGNNSGNGVNQNNQVNQNGLPSPRSSLE